MGVIDKIRERFRRDSGVSTGAEPFKEADSGYPEEGPPAVVPDDAGPPDRSEVRERSRPASEETARTPEADDGTATGNPRAAGERRG